MRQAVLRNALRFSTQTRNRLRNQLRCVHQDGSTSPHQKNVNRSSQIRENTSAAPINMSHFKALVQPLNPAARKRYQLRWDWHLRNFLMALLPPAALWVFIKLIQWRLGEYMEEYGDLFPIDELLKGTSSKSTTHAENQSTQRNLKVALNARLLERMERLEKEMDQLRSQRSALAQGSRGRDEMVGVTGGGAVEKARNISKTMVRRGNDSG